MKGKGRIAAGLLALGMIVPILSACSSGTAGQSKVAESKPKTAAVEPAVLKAGDKAPSFTLPDQYGKEISLSQYLGKKNVVLAFYVLAFTGG